MYFDALDSNCESIASLKVSQALSFQAFEASYRSSIESNRVLLELIKERERKREKETLIKNFSKLLIRISSEKFRFSRQHLSNE